MIPWILGWGSGLRIGMQEQRYGPRFWPLTASNHWVRLSGFLSQNDVYLQWLLEAIFNEERYTERTLPDRLAFREFGALMGVGCCDDDDEYLKARAESIMALWEKRLTKMTPENLRPITMVMYSAALLPTGIKQLLYWTMGLKLTLIRSFSEKCLRSRARLLESTMSRRA